MSRLSGINGDGGAVRGRGMRVPVGYHLYPGNTAEVRTLRSTLCDIRRQYGAARMAMIADAGLLLQDNMRRLEAEGHDYVVAARLRSLPQSLLKQVWDLNRYGPANGDEPRLFDITWKGRRLIVRHDPARARKDKRDREAAVERAEKKLCAGAVTSEAHLAVDDKENVYLDKDAVARDARFDWLHRVWTSLIDLSAEEVRRRYADLTTIEDGFRVPKHDLAVRPVFHWTAPRVRAHVAICFAAFALLRILAASRPPWSARRARREEGGSKAGRFAGPWLAPSGAPAQLPPLRGAPADRRGQDVQRKRVAAWRLGL